MSPHGTSGDKWGCTCSAAWLGLTAKGAPFLPAVHGVVDLVWLPWQQYQEDGRMFRGLQRGANSFTSSTGSASLELASRLVAAVEVWVCA